MVDTQLLIKKFYKDFTDSETGYLNELIDELSSLEVEIPPHVLHRMIERGILQDGAPLVVGDNNTISIAGIHDVVRALEEGAVYEFSNEGIGHTYNPYRLVVAQEQDGFTMFVKVAPSKVATTAKILDVWRRHGPIPTYPPIKAIDQFRRDWEFIPELEAYFKSESNPEAALYV